MENYLIVSVLLIIASVAYLKIASKYNIIDKPNERSSHTSITVRGGGIVFVLALVLFSTFHNFQYPYFTIGAIALAVISFLDDILTLPSTIRYPFQLGAVVLLLMELQLPFFPVYTYVFFLILGTGMINMFNFMDGINGITGMYSLASLAGIWVLNEKVQLFHQDLLYFTAIAIVVFGFYNFRKKALFFAGDIGSVTLGLLIYFLVLGLAISLEAPLVFLAVLVYGADATCTILYRKFFTNESIFAPHRHHIYQKLVHTKKIPHLKVSLGYMLLQMTVNIVMYYTYELPTNVQWLLSAAFMAIFTGTYIALFKFLSKENS